MVIRFTIREITGGSTSPYNIRYGGYTISNSGMEQSGDMSRGDLKSF